MFSGWNEIKHRYSLTYHHIPEVRQNFGELKIARDILKYMCKYVDNFIRIINLVNTLTFKHYYRLEDTDSDFDSNQNLETDTTQKTTDEIEGKTIVKLWGELVRASRALPYSALSQLLNRASSICPQARYDKIEI